MKFSKVTLLLLILGMVVGGVSWYLSEAPMFDDRVKYPDEVFQDIMTATTIGIWSGSAMLAIAVVSIVLELLNAKGKS